MSLEQIEIIDALKHKYLNHMNALRNSRVHIMIKNQLFLDLYVILQNIIIIIT